MGGVTEPVITALQASFVPAWDLPTALAAAVTALGAAGEGAPRTLLPTQLEVAVLDRVAARPDLPPAAGRRPRRHARIGIAGRYRVGIPA